MPDLPAFAELAAAPDASLDMLALALAAAFHDFDADEAMATLDALGAELSHAAAPANSMLDLVIARRRGLPILLSVVYVEVARRAGIPLAGVGLPGHFVVGHFAADPPVLLDPFGGGREIDAGAADDQLRPWTAHEIAMRMLNNLVAAYQRRGEISAAIRAAGMRLELPSDGSWRPVLEAELRAMQARLN